MAVIFQNALRGLALSAALGAVSPVSAADDRSNAAMAPKTLVQNMCARCHDVSRELKTVPPRLPGVAPAFLTVVADAKMDRTRILRVLRSPHGEMDTIVLTKRETEGVADYILGFRRQ